MKVKNKTTGNWDQITLGSVTIDNSLGSDSTTHGASVHAVNAGKISGDGSVEKIVRSETAPTGTEATIWIEPSDFDSAETTILKDTLEDEDLDKAPTVHAVKQAIDNVERYMSGYKYNKETIFDDIKLVRNCYKINTQKQILGIILLQDTLNLLFLILLKGLEKW